MVDSSQSEAAILPSCIHHGRCCLLELIFRGSFDRFGVNMLRQVTLFSKNLVQKSVANSEREPTSNYERFIRVFVEYECSKNADRKRQDVFTEGQEAWRSTYKLMLKTAPGVFEQEIDRMKKEIRERREQEVLVSKPWVIRLPHQDMPDAVNKGRSLYIIMYIAYNMVVHHVSATNFS